MQAIFFQNVILKMSKVGVNLAIAMLRKKQDCVIRQL